MRKKINPLRGIDYFTTFVTQGQAIFLICGGMLCNRNIWYKTGLPLPRCRRKEASRADSDKKRRPIRAARKTGQKSVQNINLDVAYAELVAGAVGREEEVGDDIAAFRKAAGVLG